MSWVSTRVVVSYRCGGDYEVNVYGDLDQPAGIEVGVYHVLTSDATAKRHCIDFASSELTREQDKKIVQALDLDKAEKTSDGLTFEITPPTDSDSYGGWWISVYSQEKLATSRASDSELNQISESKSKPSDWTSADMAQARPATTAATAPATPTASAALNSSSGYSSGGGSSSYSGGRVYVKGYTRNDGTYVEDHTRSTPHRR